MVSDMDARKQFLADLEVSSRDAWLRLGLQFFTKELHLETSNTVYRFLDGICFSVIKKGTSERRRGPEGLRLLGWLVTEASGEQVLSLYPRRGAPAVLWRASRDGEEAFMLTSGFVDLAKSHRDERDEAIEARRISHVRRIDPQSVARMFAAPMRKAG
jgi:hypothetical protein